MSEWIFNKLKPYALRFREWSKGKTVGTNTIMDFYCMDDGFL